MSQMQWPSPEQSRMPRPSSHIGPIFRTYVEPVPVTGRWFDDLTAQRLGTSVESLLHLNPRKALVVRLPFPSMARLQAGCVGAMVGRPAAFTTRSRASRWRGPSWDAPMSSGIRQAAVIGSFAAYFSDAV